MSKHLGERVLVTIRMAASLARRVREEAKRCGLSINDWMQACLRFKTGLESAPPERQKTYCDKCTEPEICIGNGCAWFKSYPK